MSEQADEVREIRINPIVPSESVLVATARGMRPREKEAPAPRDTRQHVDRCPFCRGNEERTPPQIAAYPAEGPWAVRIVENLHPVLGRTSQGAGLLLGLQQIIDGYGQHEVIVDHHQHGIALHEMSVEHLALLLGAYRDRMRILYEGDPRLKYVLVFKNFGPAAGASMAHTHSQVIATPVVPQNVHSELEAAHRHHQNHHQCIFCTLIDEALTFEATVYDRVSGGIRRRISAGQYVVERGEEFIAIKPFASRFEWEVHILPLAHQADYTTVADHSLEDLARVLQRTMARLDAVLGGAQYNYFLHSLPHGPEYAGQSPSYHWHLEICPRTSIPTGFELGSGLYVNTIAPEQAAERLRAVTL
ncbi:DUF4921 family protein [Ectothiorhodospiraceae bacterium 2226]|nr:DUF4921 family protein [Ectothiorhodospiraceae bacterium 2226]